jgi:predicted  nucleic acid-binding Zn-ribbon protein
VYIEWRLQPDVFGIGLFLFNQKEVMMSRTQRLYELQQVELEAESVARRLREITTQLGESADLQRARNIVTQAEGRLNKQRAQMKGLELEVGGLSQKIEADEGRLYSGRVTNPKELAGLHDEVDSLKRWHEKKEDDLLEAMLATEEAEGALADARAILGQVTDTWRDEQGDLVDEQSRLQARLEGLREQREALVTGIDPDDLAIYQRLRRQKGGRAVAAVKDGICEGCRMNPPSSQVQRAGTGSELVFCNNCGRILHIAR